MIPGAHSLDYRARALLHRDRELLSVVAEAVAIVHVLQGPIEVRGMPDWDEIVIYVSSPLPHEEVLIRLEVIMQAWFARHAHRGGGMFSLDAHGV